MMRVNSRASIPVLVIVAVAVAVAVQGGSITVEQKIRDDSDLSQFYQLLESSPVANSTLQLRQVTLFVPTNRAFQKYKGNTEGLVLYHMSNLAQTIDELGTSLLSELTGSPPLWVTRRPGPYRNEVYINNAKILQDRSNYQSTINFGKPSRGYGEKQVLHVIDQVLEPVRSNPTSQSIYNPDALQFLNQSETLDLGPHRVRTFRQKVTLCKKEGIFKAEGRYTFFIPVEEGFKPATRSGRITPQVIDGHVISGHVLFTAPTPNDEPYRTLAFTDNVKVTVSFVTQQDSKGIRTYVKSTTLAGGEEHMAGVVMAEIVKGNIPVRNGVVHLIQRPLMVVDTSVKEFLEDKDDGPVYKFYEAILDAEKEVIADITQQKAITIFAPSNAAWNQPSVSSIRQDRKRITEILKLHYIREQLPLDTIINKNRNQVPTAAIRKSLYFNVIQGANGNKTLTVEGGGVNATVLTADIAATNGVIHIIDRVLGVPYTTVAEKLMTDPMLNSTYLLGQRDNFNDRLNDTKKRFTYFVPRESAWQEAAIKYPSTYKKLFMPEMSYHATQILERHLVISDQSWTMAKLKSSVYNDTIILSTARDQLKLRIKESGESYQVEWQGKWIHVFRPDVECTNGIIHVIDSVFLKDSDVYVNGGGSSLVTFTSHLVMILIAKWLL